MDTSILDTGIVYTGGKYWSNLLWVSTQGSCCCNDDYMEIMLCNSRDMRLTSIGGGADEVIILI